MKRSNRNEISRENEVQIKEKDIKVVTGGGFCYPHTAMSKFAKWLEFVETWQPEEVYLLGDLFQFDLSLKRIPLGNLSNPLRRLQDQLHKVKEKILDEIRRAVPKSRIIYLEGSMELQLRRWCTKQQLDFETDVLSMLGLDALNIEYVPEGRLMVGKFLFSYGEFSHRKSIASAKAELNKNGISGCSVASRFLGTHYKTTYTSQMVWFETGRMEKDRTIYSSKKRKKHFVQNGFIFGWFTADRKHFLFNPTLLNKRLVYTKGKKKLVFFDPKLTSQQTQLAMGCIHIPHQHKKSMKALLEFIERLRPSVVHLTGDIGDFCQFSYFEDGKDPKIVVALQRDLAKVRGFLQQVRDLVPDAKIFYYEGNHERRVKNYLRENAPLLIDYKALQVPEMLGLKEMNISWIPSNTTRKEDAFIIRHGDYVARNSGESAKKELEHKDVSGLGSHVHRLGSYFETDCRGTRERHEIGCLCRYDMGYMKKKDQKGNWQRGFALIFKEKRGNKKTIKVLLIPCIKGIIYFADKFLPHKEKE